MELFKELILEKFDCLVDELEPERFIFTFEKDFEITKILAGRSEDNARIMLKEELDKLEEFNFEQYKKDEYIVFQLSTFDGDKYILLYFEL